MFMRTEMDAVSCDFSGCGNRTSECRIATEATGALSKLAVCLNNWGIERDFIVGIDYNCVAIYLDNQWRHDIYPIIGELHILAWLSIQHTTKVDSVRIAVRTIRPGQ